MQSRTRSPPASSIRGGISWLEQRTISPHSMPGGYRSSEFDMTMNPNNTATRAQRWVTCRSQYQQDRQDPESQFSVCARSSPTLLPEMRPLIQTQRSRCDRGPKDSLHWPTCSKSFIDASPGGCSETFRSQFHGAKLASSRRVRDMWVLTGVNAVNKGSRTMRAPVFQNQSTL